MQRLIESCQLFICLLRQGQIPGRQTCQISPFDSLYSFMLKALDASAAALNHAFLLEQQDTIGHHRTPHTHNLSCSLGSDFDAMKLRREFCQVADGGYDSKPIFLCNFCTGRCKHLPYGRETRHCNFFPDTSCPLNTLFPQTVWPQ